MTFPILLNAIEIVWLALALRALFVRRLVTRRALAVAPLRRGSMGPQDIAITLGLFLLGPSMVLASFADESSTLGQRMLFNQAGLIPAISYILWRADTAIVGGIGGLGLRPREIPLSLGHSFLSLLVILPLTQAVSAGLIALLRAMGEEPEAIAHQALKELVVAQVGSPQWWTLAASAVLVAPIIEELIFRGLLQTALLQSGLVVGRWTAIAASAGVFTFIHLDAVPPHALPGLYVLAVGLGWAYERWGSLWTPIFIHAGFNALNIAAAPWIEN